jgi:hypothetical protein
MTTGTKVVWTGISLDSRKPKVFKGTIIRVDPPEDGWNEGIVVEYPKIKYLGQQCAIFHELPSRYVVEV